MTGEDIAKLVGALGAAPLTLLVVKLFADRKAEKEKTEQHKFTENSTLSIAALGSYKDMIEDYRKREERHELRINALLSEVQELRAAKSALVKNSKQFLLLIVEDDEGVIKSIRNFLHESEEFTVVSCDRWAVAEKYLSESRPDISLIDLELPDSTPAETIARVGEFHGDHPTVPVALITGHSIGSHFVPPVGVKIAHKGDILASQKKLEAFLYSVLNA